MLDLTLEHIGYGLDATMRMPGKSGPVAGRIVVAEIVEQQERIALRRIAESEDAVQVHARPFRGRHGAAFALHGSERHVASPVICLPPR